MMILDSLNAALILIQLIFAGVSKGEAASIWVAHNSYCKVGPYRPQGNGTCYKRVPYCYRHYNTIIHEYVNGASEKMRFPVMPSGQGGGRQEGHLPVAAAAKPSLTCIQHARVAAMSLCLVLLALLGVCVGEKSVPSVNFDGDSEIEFGKSVVENEVAGDEYLRNFKSLHNSTDLEALASETESTVTAAGEDEEEEDVISRADTGTRVLRGAGPDLHTGPALDHPLFTPFKHNKIDTADFSDCALQGEWKPIGVPHHHYEHHEDTQKEHFHHASPEGLDGFSGNAHSSPLDDEGLAFWNQLLRETHGSPSTQKHVKHPRKPKPQHTNKYHNHHHHQLPHPIQSLDVFEKLRKPGSDSNLFKIQEKPHHTEVPLPQSLLTSQPNFNDVEYALLQATTHDGVQPSNHQLAQQQIVHHNDDFLSPPPVPHRFLANPKPKLPHTRPKHVHKVHHKGKPHRPPPPPPVVEQPDVHNHAHSAYPAQIPAESSTFTCGHNHAAGTNYHTASYQVEGESDPSLLAEEVTGNNYLSPPIIVGEPNLDIFENVEEHTFPNHAHAHAPDLEEEGTETGDSNGDEEIAQQVKQFSPFGEKVESSTQSGSLETTAPQTFHHDNEQPGEKIRQPQFDIGFDHSGFSEVDINAFPAHVQSVAGSDRFNIKAAENQQQGSPVNVHQEQVFSQSEPFASHFPVSFAEFDIKNHGPQKAVIRKPFSNPPPSSFSEFTFPPLKPGPKGKPFKAGIAVSDHGPSFNHSKSHLPPKRKRPHKQYEVSENSGEMIPLSAFFPPKKMPKQFDMRKPNLAVPKAKRPKNAPPPKYQSTVHFDGSNLGVYQTRPRNKVTKIRLKAKPNRGTAQSRFPEPDFRRSLTIKSRIP